MIELRLTAEQKHPVIIYILPYANSDDEAGTNYYEEANMLYGALWHSLPLQTLRALQARFSEEEE